MLKRNTRKIESALKRSAPIWTTMKDQSYKKKIIKLIYTCIIINESRIYGALTDRACAYFRNENKLAQF